VVALAAVGLMVAGAGTGQNPSSSHPGFTALIGSPTTEPGVGRLAGAGTVASMVDAVRPSTVLLTAVGPDGTVTSTGVVVESGGIIVAIAGAVDRATSITAVEADGTRQAATLVGVDRTSDLAVVSVSNDLPAATFDTGDPSTGSVAFAMALEPLRHPAKADAASPLLYAGTVTSTGQAADVDAVTRSFAATTIEAPLADGDLGCPLLDDSGHVAGLLDTVRRTGSATVAVFLPAELVMGVAEQLVSSGQVESGWMGVEVSDAGAAAPDGARLDLIEDGSPAVAGGMVDGDVITAVDGEPVHSAAELRTRLYALPPGTELQVTFERGGTSMTGTVALGDGDGDAPAGGGSP
jgi:S1-C subfamily serine protease